MIFKEINIKLFKEIMKYISDDKNTLSTRTIIAKMNRQFLHVDIYSNLLIHHLISPYSCQVVAMYHKDKPRGDFGYFEKKKKLSSFRNAVNIIIKDEQNNLFNIKLSDKGNFQISGAKHLDRTYQAIQYLIELILHCCPNAIIDTSSGEPIEISFTTVMTNFIYDSGFKIDKEKLNQLMIDDKSHDFYNLFETSFGYTGLNLKLAMNPNDYDIKIPVFQWSDHKWSQKEKKYSALGKENKFNSFLVFHSGKIIISGMNETTMNDAYVTFSDYIEKNRPIIQECIQ